MYLQHKTSAAKAVGMLRGCGTAEEFVSQLDLDAENREPLCLSVWLLSDGVLSG